MALRCVLEVTQAHIHIHTHTFTPWRVPRGGGLEGRHAHGELEAHGGGGEEYGSCVRENDGCRDSRAMVCKEGVGGGPREAIPGGIMGGRRACVLTKCSQRAVEGVCDCLRLRVSVRFAFRKTLFTIALFSLSLSAPQQSEGRPVNIGSTMSKPNCLIYSHRLQSSNERQQTCAS